MTVFVAFVIAVSANGMLVGSSFVVANESACKELVVDTVLKAQNSGAEVLSLGCHPVDIEAGEDA